MALTVTNLNNANNENGYSILSQVPWQNNLSITGIGSGQLKTGGGHLQGPGAVTSAGSADCVCTLYDGTSASGQPITTFSMGTTGQVVFPNYAYATGLFAVISGTTSGTATILST